MGAVWKMKKSKKYKRKQSTWRYGNRGHGEVRGSVRGPPRVWDKHDRFFEPTGTTRASIVGATRPPFGYHRRPGADGAQERGAVWKKEKIQKIQKKTKHVKIWKQGTRRGQGLCPGPP